MQQESTSSLEQWVRGILDEADKLTIGTVLRLAEVRRELKLLTAELAEARMELQASENKCHALKKRLEESESARNELTNELDRRFREATRYEDGQS